VEDAYFWVVENDLGEPIDIIYQHEPYLSSALVELLQYNGWEAVQMHTPEPAWEFLQIQNPLRL
jgi:hypothetical protein